MKPEEVTNELRDVFWDGHCNPDKRGRATLRIAELVTATGLEQELLNVQHELAILHDTFKLYPGAWCCETARRSNGWDHVSTCKNWVLVY